ncbi:ABC transporter permease [Pseudarcicella hirudinis]|nr:FtsX-like permease family protein [Pseudarcicella hirudinis]
MNLIKISWSNLKDKPLTSFLSISLMALGIGIISLLLLVSKQLDEKFTRNVKGIDMVIGAKGSPLQLILASIYQIDAPTGNIPLEEATKLTRSPLVKTAIPLSMGDNYQGYRVIGTNEKYLQHFEVEYAEGKVFSKAMEVVAGAKAAQNLELKVGDSFVSQHGYDGEGHKHDEQKFKVTGILKTNNSVVDQLILTPLESVWAVHEHHEEGEQHADSGANALKLLEEDGSHKEEHEEEPKEITSMLIKFRNPALGMMMARNINQNTTLQTATPAIEINRLFALLGVGLDTLKWIALVIIIVSGLSVFVSLYNSLKERKYEMALMLSMGATRIRLFLLLLLEGLMISIIGYAAGVLLSRLGLWVMAENVEKNFHYDFNVLSLLPEEMYLMLGALVIGLLAAALPSLGIYRINISRTLADE